MIGRRGDTLCIGQLRICNLLFELLKLFFLDLNDRPIAAAMCIDYQDTVYLYNSGYDADFRQLSAGLMSKVLSIQASIRDGRQVYDFLKGAEIYKKRLGGKPVDICRCVLDLDAGPADEPSADEKDRMVACRPIR